MRHAERHVVLSAPLLRPKTYMRANGWVISHMDEAGHTYSCCNLLQYKWGMYTHMNVHLPLATSSLGSTCHTGKDIIMYVYSLFSIHVTCRSQQNCSNYVSDLNSSSWPPLAWYSLLLVCHAYPQIIVCVYLMQQIGQGYNVFLIYVTCISEEKMQQVMLRISVIHVTHWHINMSNDATYMDESYPTAAWVMSHTWMQYNATTCWWMSHCTHSLMEKSRHTFQHLLALLLSRRGFLDHTVFYQSSPYPFTLFSITRALCKEYCILSKKKQRHNAHTYIHEHIPTPACAAAVQTRHSRDIPLLAWFPDSAAPLPLCYVWMSHVTHMNDSCVIPEWVKLHIVMNRVIHKSCHTYDMPHSFL